MLHLISVLFMTLPNITLSAHMLWTCHRILHICSTLTGIVARFCSYSAVFVFFFDDAHFYSLFLLVDVGYLFVAMGVIAFSWCLACTSVMLNGFSFHPIYSVDIFNNIIFFQNSFLIIIFNSNLGRCWLLVCSDGCNRLQLMPGLHQCYVEWVLISPDIFCRYF